ncbi:hypothetical protein GSU69_13320 [Rathayibacter festucae]|uniref:DnaA N-terminal domain-containing protein n=1 Tax=Rathayibacter festucae TaxID=110937 RepID=A0ABX6H1A7_9MICO|nr:hypothetical protein [Rathayibacter festucae]QHC63562.1 hypothetical protein GSU69_13320 [Rathayibacter festucae]
MELQGLGLRRATDRIIIRADPSATAGERADPSRRAGSLVPARRLNDTNEVFAMPTQPSDVPLEPVAQSAGDPVPELGGSAEEAPISADPSLQALRPDEAPSSDDLPGDDADEVRRLRTQVDALLNDPFDLWVERIQVGGVTASGFEHTLSWRVTKPLRLVRTFQIRVRQLGLPGAIGHSARFAKRRLSGRAR